MQGKEWDSKANLTDDSLPTILAGTGPTERRRKLGHRILAVGALVGFGWGILHSASKGWSGHCGGGIGHHGYASESAALDAAKCPAQPSARNIGADWNPLDDDKYATLAGDRLSRAVQQRTESFDAFIYLEANDPALDKHYAFADWLKSEYPQVFGKLEHEVVNYHGHLLTWQGSNKDLQPIVLMAHTDTVPVINETLDQWTYPPFEGKVAPGKGLSGKEETYIWGRGASDCKNSLLGIFGAVEKLVQEGFEPERTILIASGFDEEVSRRREGLDSSANLLRSVVQRALSISPTCSKSVTDTTQSLSYLTKVLAVLPISMAPLWLASEWQRKAQSTFD